MVSDDCSGKKNTTDHHGPKGLFLGRVNEGEITMRNAPKIHRPISVSKLKSAVYGVFLITIRDGKPLPSACLWCMMGLFQKKQAFFIVLLYRRAGEWR
jgi:hypothetical protein